MPISTLYTTLDGIPALKASLTCSIIWQTVRSSSHGEGVARILICGVHIGGIEFGSKL
jgi:hypothetical protein